MHYRAVSRDPAQVLSSGMSNPIHVVLLIALIAFWIVPALLTARLAERKGRSFAVYLVASLVIGWLIPLIAALVVAARPSRSA
jgi:ABC-type transporter Mla maintaining outer membrane lipid asymmetry permease subunit MlaE